MKHFFIYCELLTGEHVIILKQDNDVNVGEEIFIDINTKNIQAFNIKNDIRLL